jgi:phage terminase large subunit-like protein
MGLMTTDRSVPEEELGPLAESVAPRSRNTRKKWTGDARTEELLDERIADRFQAFPDLARQLDAYRGHAANVRVAVALRAGMIARARTDPAAMMEFVFDKPNHEPARLGWAHRLWLELMQEHARLLIVAPRRHWKTGVTLGYILYRLGREPDLLTKVVCQSDGKAVKRVSFLRELIEKNKRLAAVFPDMFPTHKGRRIDLEWNKHALTVPRRMVAPDPSIEALGITSSASGDRADLVFADDVVDRRNAITLPKVRQQIRESWDDWVNLLGDGGSIFYACTLWSSSDLTTDLLKNPGWAIAWFEVTTALGTYVRMPDGSEFKHRHPVWGTDPNCRLHGHEYFGVSRDEFAAKMDAKPKSDRWGPICELLASGKIKLGDDSCRCGPWTRKALEKRRQDIGSRKFARGFSNRPMADDEKRVKPNWIRWAWELDENGLTMLDEHGQKAPKVINPTWPRVLIFDSSSSLKKTADWLGFCALALDEENRKIYVIEGRHYRLAFPDKVRLCKASYKFFRPVDNMLFEKAGGGTELFQELVLNTRLPVVGVRARASKMDRLDRITPLMESGMVEFMPYLDPDTHPRDDDIGSVVSELRDAPSGEHDDIMDAYVHGVRFVNRMYEAFYFVQDGTEGVMPGDALDQDDDETEAEKGTDESEDGSRVSVF